MRHGGWVTSGAGVAASLALGFAACAPHAPPRVVAPPAFELPGLSVVSPARWLYHPRAPDRALAALHLDGGACLLTAAGGERWLTTPAAAHPNASGAGAGACAGRAVAAATTAPEDLVAIVRRAKGFVLAGANGSLFLVDDALGPITKTLAAPTPMVRVAASGEAVLGVSADGALYAWRGTDATAAPAFHRLADPPARFADAAIDAGGRALALALPEALWSSDDGGASWSKVAAPTIGAHHLGVTPKGELAAQGVFESLVFAAGARPGSSAPRRVREAAVAADAPGKLDAARGPSATAIAQHMAALDGERYVEIVPPDDAKGEGPFRLARGKLGEDKLELAPLDVPRGCTDLAIALRASVVAIACSSKGDDRVSVRLQRSFDLGASWAPPVELVGSDDDVRLAASQDGAVLVGGACKIDVKDDCKSGAPLVVRGPAKSPTVVASSVDKLGGPGAGFAFSFDGRSAYFVGKRAKDDKVALYVSHDAGDTFAERALDGPEPRPQPPSATPADEEDQDAQEAPHEIDLDFDATAVITTTEDALVGVSLVGVYVLTDDDGHVLSSAAGPADGSFVSGYGRRALAVGVPDHDGGVWESSDAGLTWDVAPFPRVLARTGGDVRVACAAAGCVVADATTRLGWGIPPDADVDGKPPDAQRPREPHVRTPIVCELSATSRWTRVDHAHGRGGLPDASEAMRGRVMWSAMTHDPATDAVSVVVATLPDRDAGEARVSTRSLLAAAPRANVATHLSHQIEGYLAMRAPFPVDAKGHFEPRGSMRDVEVAWENFADGSAGRARIPDAGPFEKDDMRFGTALEPALVTVSLRSAIVRPHSVRSKDTSVYFLRADGGVQRLVDTPAPPRALAGALRAVTDAAVLDGQPFAVALAREAAGNDATSSVLLARLGAAPGSWTATAVAPLDSETPFGVQTTWATFGKSSVGIVSTVTDADGRRAWASFAPFRADGAAAPGLAVPTPYDLGDKPRGCSAVERASTPRVDARIVAPGRVAFFGVRHPVIVQEPAAKGARALTTLPPYILLSDSVILHGTPAAPCVAAHVAHGFGDARGTAAIVTGDGAHGFLFLPTTAPAEREGAAPHAKRAEAGVSFEYRAMTCRYDAAARVPEGVFAEPGTTR